MIIIKTTVNKQNIKKKIITILISKKYAACVNVIENIKSNYIWKNKIITDKEDILLIKTTKEKENLVYKTIKEMHNYDTPEISTLKTSKVDKNYLDWLLESTR